MNSNTLPHTVIMHLASQMVFSYYQFSFGDVDIDIYAQTGFPKNNYYTNNEPTVIVMR